MGSAESKCIQFITAIKSESVELLVQWPDDDQVYKELRYDGSCFDRFNNDSSYGQASIKVDENRKWGFGIGYPEIRVTLKLKKKIIKFVLDDYAGGLDQCGRISGTGLDTWLFYIYEDGVHIGPEPHGWFWGKGKDNRRIIPWKNRQYHEIRSMDGKAVHIDYLD